MNYISTRGRTAPVTCAQAIKQGLADDGGLFMPECMPTLTVGEIEMLCELPYARRAAFILGKFLTDYTTAELEADCEIAYGEDRFPGGAAPLVSADSENRIHFLELWHGPTCAFKDMALQIMPRLLTRALAKTGEKRTALILVATSGDTGKAALEGYRDVDGVKIMVFYPENGVSAIQKLQMATQAGENVFVQSVRGNFDDAQSGVKRIFSDASAAAELDAQGLFFSSANSINWGRLAPQIAYYVSAYCDLVTGGSIRMGDPIDVCVPTGNFGNIFAAYIAKRMGLPIGKFLCASNQNNVLTDFLRTGTYDRRRTFYTTISPSMDILISSNLERLLYLLAGSERTAGYMEALARDGVYTVDADVLAAIKSEFVGYYCDEEATANAMRDTFARLRYTADPHTAVAIGAAMQAIGEQGATRETVVGSTASPYKFAVDVCKVHGISYTDDFSAFSALHSASGTEIPTSLAALASREIRFSPDASIDPACMYDAVKKFAANT